MGDDRIRFGTAQTFDVVVGNSGLNDAYGVPVWIGGAPKSGSLALAFPAIERPPESPDGAPIEWTADSTRTEGPDGLMMPLFLPYVPAGRTRLLQVTASAAQEPGMRLTVRANPSYFDSSLTAIATADYAALVESFLPGVGIEPGSLTGNEISADFTSFLDSRVAGVGHGPRSAARRQRLGRTAEQPQCVEGHRHGADAQDR